MAFHGLRRRALLGAVVCAAGGTALGASTAAASSMEPVESYEFDGSVHYWNQGANDQTKILSYNGYQYVAYWDERDEEGNDVLTLVRRRLSDDRRETVALNTADGHLQREGDYHNTAVLGISKVDGRLHVAWTNHNQAMKYAISNSACLSKARFTECSFTWREVTGDVSEEKVAYDQFFNDVTGNLYMAWRYRNSVNGRLMLAAYNNNGTWTHKGPIIDGSTGEYDPDGAWTDTDRDRVAEPGEPGYLGTSGTRGVYVDNIMFDPDDRLHMTWSFRESDAGTGNGEWGANLHDVYYAYSTDLGRTWFNNNARQIGSVERRGAEAITIADHSDALVVSVPVGYWRSNFGRMTLDWDWQPHMVWAVSDTLSWNEFGYNFRYRHVWRSKDGTWHDQWLTPAEQGIQYATNGSLLFDKGNNAYFIGAHNEFGWLPYNRPGALEYNTELPGSNMTWQEGSYMHVVPFSEITAVTTYGQVGTTIGTRSTENSVVEIRMRNNSNSSSFNYNFITTSQTGWEAWEAGMRAEFRVTNDNTWRTVRTTVASGSWRGTLRAFEVEMVGATSGEIDIDYIRIQNGGGAVAKDWAFDAGTKLIGAEASAGAGYEDWTTYDLLPDEAIGNVSLFLDDVAFNVDYTRYELEKVLNLTTVRQGAPGTSRLHVEELDIAEDDPYVKLWEWGVPGDEIGWTEVANVSSLTQATDGATRVLSGSISAARPQIYSGRDDLHAKIEGADTIRIRMKNETAREQRARVCWTVNGGTTFREEQCTSSFSVTANNAYNIYEIEPVGLSGWRAENELSQLRFEPASDGRIRTGRFRIDYIRILDNRP